MDDDFIEIEEKIRKVEDSKLPQHRVYVYNIDTTV